jgi:hypothetical protein
MQICNSCKAKLQEYYNFKMRFNQTRNIQNSTSQKQLENKEKSDPLVCNNLIIVKSESDAKSVKCIEQQQQQDEATISEESLNMEPEYLDEDEQETEQLDESEIDYESLDEGEAILDTSSNSSSMPMTVNLKRPRHISEWKCKTLAKHTSTRRAHWSTGERCSHHAATAEIDAPRASRRSTGK